MTTDFDFVANAIIANASDLLGQSSVAAEIDATLNRLVPAFEKLNIDFEQHIDLTCLIIAIANAEQLQGSEKQVLWANKIRARRLFDLSNLTKKPKRHQKPNKTN
jgi:hypothetical protein